MITSLTHSYYTVETASLHMNQSVKDTQIKGDEMGGSCSTNEINVK